MLAEAQRRIAELHDRWTAAKAAFLDASVSSRATGAVPAADATANAEVRDVVGNKTDAAVTTVGTNKSLMAYVKGLLGKSVIKSIQYGVVVISTGTSATATITSVNTAKAVVLNLGSFSSGAATSTQVLAGLTLTNGTTVTANRGLSTSENTDVYFCVVEFE